MTHPKRVMFGFVAETTKALASPVRVKILDLLAQGSRSVESIAAAACLSVANASQHLQHLRRAGFLTARRIGKQTLYTLADDKVVDMLRTVSMFTEQHMAEAEKALSNLYRNRDRIEPVTGDELLKRIADRSGITIDVRPELEFRAAHIPSAINIPVEHLPKRLAEIPTGQDIVAYCRGPYCVYAYEAIEILRPAGLSARRLFGGFLEWRRKNMPIVGGETPDRRTPQAPA